jgi:hypothetical protein
MQDPIPPFVDQVLRECDFICLFSPFRLSANLPCRSWPAYSVLTKVEAGCSLLFRLALNAMRYAPCALRLTFSSNNQVATDDAEGSVILHPSYLVWFERGSPIKGLVKIKNTSP